MYFSFKNISKKIKDNLILSNINFKINLNGKVQAFVGPNGAGKSTLMKIISKIILPTDGVISNYDIYKNCDVFFVPTGTEGMIGRLTLKENLEYFAALKGVDLECALVKLKNYNKVLQVDDLVEKRFINMSTGQKKMSVLLMSVSLDSQIIILDEPSNGLDLESKEKLINLIKVISVDRSKKIIISSHDFDFLSSLVDEYIFMNNGRIAGKINSKISLRPLINFYDGMIDE